MTAHKSSLNSSCSSKRLVAEKTQHEALLVFKDGLELVEIACGDVDTWVVGSECRLGRRVVGCGLPSSSFGSSTSADGQTLVNEQCGRCHPLERVVGVTKDQAGWTATVTRMRKNGLSVTDAQAAAIIDYLTTRDSAK